MQHIDAVRVMAPMYNCKDTIRAFIQNGNNTITPIIEVQKSFALHNVDFEFFAMDGKSNDGTAEILKEYSQTFPWFHHIENSEDASGNNPVGVIRLGYCIMLDAHNLKKVLYQHVALVRLNANLEHDPNHIIRLVTSIRDHDFHGAIQQLRYASEHQSAIDYSLNQLMAAFQNYVIPPRKGRFLHHCPEYTAYRGDVVNHLLPLYDGYCAAHMNTYGCPPYGGGDLIMLFLAFMERYHIDHNLFAISLRSIPNRNIKEVMEQVAIYTNHLLLMQIFRKKIRGS